VLNPRPVGEAADDEAREPWPNWSGVGEPTGVTAALHLQAGVVLSTILDQADAMDARLLGWVRTATGALHRLLAGQHRGATVAPVPCGRYWWLKNATGHLQMWCWYRLISPWSLSALKLAGVLAPQAELVLLHAFEALLNRACNMPGSRQRRSPTTARQPDRRHSLQLQALVKARTAAESARMSVHTRCCRCYF